MGTAAIEVVLGAGGATVMAVAILFSTFGCNNGLILSGPRVYYAMARDNLFFERAGTLHPTYRTPVFGLVARRSGPACSASAAPTASCSTT